MSLQIEAADPEVCRTVRQNATVAGYLRGLGALCLEGSRHPELLPVFLAVIGLMPKTLAELEREARRIAA